MTREEFAKFILDDISHDGYKYRTNALMMWTLEVDKTGEPIAFKADHVDRLVEMAASKDGNAFDALAKIAADAIECGLDMPKSLRVFASEVLDKVREGEKPRHKRTRASRDQDRNQRICSAIHVLCDESDLFDGPKLTKEEAFTFVSRSLGVSTSDSPFGGVDDVWKNRRRWYSLLNN